MRAAQVESTGDAPPLVAVLDELSESLIKEIGVFGASHYSAGDPNLDPVYLRWLCLDNPCGVAKAVLIRDQGRLVGQAILVPVDLKVESARQTGYFAVNVLTHPEYRNRRLFSAIIEAAKDFVSGSGEWLLGHPNAAALPGWTRKQMTFRTPLVPTLSGLDLAVGRSIETIDSERRLACVWPILMAQMTGQDRAVQVARTVEYMSWRFMRRPDRKYRLQVCHDRRGELAGFYVAKAWKPLLDLVVDHGVCSGSVASLHTRRPSIIMLPSDRQEPRARRVASWRLPVRKTMPFFATTFTEDELDFDGVTLAASDF